MIDIKTFLILYPFLLRIFFPFHAALNISRLALI